MQFLYRMYLEPRHPGLVSSGILFPREKIFLSCGFLVSDRAFSVESVFLLVYRQNPDLKEKLLATGDANLIEGTTWKDKIWGVDLATMKGKNRLGKILMEVRETLKEKTGHSK